jgi:mannose-6-phosphate isomerase-like protein (cupin superfamily)
MSAIDDKPAGFRRVNLFSLPLNTGDAHGGSGTLRWALVASPDQVAAACHAIHYAELSPEASIGEHPHQHDSEEYYLILSGSGRLRLGDETLDVAAGDLIRNDPGQTHGLVNTGPEPLRFFVFDAETRSS